MLLVAATADQQISALPEFVAATDEVATTFGDAFLLVRQLEHTGLVSSEAASALRELDEHFERMPDDGRLADPASLRDHPFWESARRMATDALKRLGEEKRPPKLPGTKWVRG
ncbi:MAG: hypothetical protein IPG45_16175 [Deltaproteobacteria bacterium]|nr:hypothetical protein [Deltaproteobacteria bacterium]